MTQHRIILCSLHVALTAVLVFLTLPAPLSQAASWEETLAELEQRSSGRLGVAAVDTATGERLGYRAEERFPLCSTFKVMLVGAVLHQDVTDKTLLTKRIAVKRKDLVFWSPVVEKRVGKDMSVEELCEAAIRYSDNAASNLLLRLIGGPEKLTHAARSMGDAAFRLDRWETPLNSAVPGDPRDTTTPAAMAGSLERLALGDVLDEPRRERLLAWLKGNTTGDNGIRAGLPQGWVSGDKTGSGAYGTTNHIAVIWPPKGTPVILAVYFTQKEQGAPRRWDVIAEVTRLVCRVFPNKGE